MKLWISNQLKLGVSSWDPFSVPPGDCEYGGIGLEYPAGSCIEHLYGAGPWIGGIVNGVRRVDEGYNGDDGSSEFLPERQDTARDRIWHTHSGLESYDSNGYSGYYYNHHIRVNRRGVDDDGDGKIDEDELDGLDNDGDWNPLTDDLGSDGLPDSLEVSCDGKAFDPVTNPDPAFDNYDTSGVDRCHSDVQGNLLRKLDKNLYTQNNGIPDHGEPHVDEDYGAVSDNDLYFSATDTFKSFLGLPDHVPMGVKVFAKSYAWQSLIPEPILPIEYDFINVGKNTIQDVYLGFFVDADIGPINVLSYFTHNSAGYFRDLRAPYELNCVDRGSTPLAVTLLGSSRPLDSLNYVFQWHGFCEGCDDSIYYSWMSGQAFQYPIKVDQSCLSYTDTRFFFFFGPFGIMHPGDTVKYWLAFVSGDALDIGPNNLRENIVKARYWHQRGYHPPVVPPSPPLHVTLEKNKVLINWKWRQCDPGMDPMETWDSYNNLLDGLPDTSWRKRNPPPGETHGGRNFEGYRVWRSESKTFDNKSFTLLAEYRLDNDTAFGYHAGLTNTLVDSLVRRGNNYWYAVTSFSVPNGIITSVRDSAGRVQLDTTLMNSFESSVSDNAVDVRLAFGPSKRPGEAKVVPNPYRGDFHYTDGNGFEGAELTWGDTKRVIWFIDLPDRATIRIFTLAGEVITTIQHDDAARSATGRGIGQEEWNLFSESGRPIASGIYIFSVESKYGTQVGKFVVIR